MYMYMYGNNTLEYLRTTSLFTLILWAVPMLFVGLVVLALLVGVAIGSALVPVRKWYRQKR